MNRTTFFWIGITAGFLLNFTGWLGNNLVLGNMWDRVTVQVSNPAWRDTIWRHVFSFLPDFIYGFGIIWLIILLNKNSTTWFQNALIAGLAVSMLGGITAYFGIANSGFIPWDLALASFVLVFITKVGVALLAAWWIKNHTGSELR